jgi:hypothetical protein
MDHTTFLPSNGQSVCSQGSQTGCRKSGFTCRLLGFAGIDVVALQRRNDFFIAAVINSKEVLPTSRLVKISSIISYLSLLTRRARLRKGCMKRGYSSYCIFTMQHGRSGRADLWVTRLELSNPSDTAAETPQCTWWLTSGKLLHLEIRSHAPAACHHTGWNVRSMLQSCAKWSQGMTAVLDCKESGYQPLGCGRHARERMENIMNLASTRYFNR